MALGSVCSPHLRKPFGTFNAELQYVPAASLGQFLSWVLTLPSHISRGRWLSPSLVSNDDHFDGEQAHQREILTAV